MSDERGDASRVVVSAVNRLVAAGPVADHVLGQGRRDERGVGVRPDPCEHLADHAGWSTVAGVLCSIMSAPFRRFSALNLSGPDPVVDYL
jgi:hypothetical protein